MRDFFECYLNLPQLDIDNGCINSLYEYFNGLNMTLEKFDQMLDQLGEDNTDFSIIKEAADNIKRLVKTGNSLLVKSIFYLRLLYK